MKHLFLLFTAQQLLNGVLSQGDLNLFETDYFDTLPTFFHSCNFYGGITEALMEKYEIDKYRMVLFEKGEGVFKDTEVVYNPDGSCSSFAPLEQATDSFAEHRMIDSCKLFKNKYGMDKVCFIYYNALLSWIWYDLNHKYVDFVAADPNVIPWKRDGDKTFPDSNQMPVFDMRESVPQVMEFWVGEIEKMVKSDENKSYIDGIFVDRGFIRKTGEAEFTKNGKTSLTAFFNDYSAGKRLALNELEKRGIKTLVNPGSFYYTHLKGDYLPKTTPDSDIYSFNKYLEDSSMIHLEKCCIEPDTLYKMSMALKAGKEVQCHGGMIEAGHCGGIECRDHLRGYLATYLFGMEKYSKSYFACHRFWSLNQDAGDCRDQISARWVRNDFVRPMEYDMPLGVPQEREDENGNPVVIDGPNFNRRAYRAFLNRNTGELQAVAVWDADPFQATVCYVDDCEKNLDITKGKKCFGNPNHCPDILAKFLDKYKPPTAAPTTAGQTPTNLPNNNPVTAPTTTGGSTASAATYTLAISLSLPLIFLVLTSQ